MKQLEQGIREYKEKFVENEDDGFEVNAGLRKTASEWAKASLNLYTGDLLKKALGISAAVADFLAELETPS